MSAATYKENLFQGKVLFITGGRSGIGYQIAQDMMKFGVDSVIVGRDAKGLAESAKALQASTGRKCVPAAADVRKPEEIQAAVAKAKEAFGRIDFVVCGAAGNFLAPIEGLSENAFRTVVEIDLLGTYNTIKATLPLVRASKGAYLHISATLHYRGTPYQAHVGAAKAGVDALSNALAVEEGPKGVRSNIVAPGPVGDTEGMSRLAPIGRNEYPHIPLGRMATKGEVADAAIFLFSPAGQYITGQTLVVDGGDQHMRLPSLPYPQSVLDYEGTKKLFKGKL